MLYFRNHFPHDWSRPEYLTEDKIIPYKLFCMMIKASEANRAIDRLNFLAAVQLGMATVQGGDNHALQRIREDTVREALGQN
jgi:hypothetical protein